VKGRSASSVEAETVDNVAQQLLERGYAALSADELQLPSELESSRQALLTSWDGLCQDAFMGDGGTYRFRRYGRFRLRPQDGALEPLEGSSIFQSLEDNPLNGGVVRTFAPLLPETAANPFLHYLIRFDFARLPIEPAQTDSWVVGVHQLRILARPGEVGHPTPEGIHIDGEAFTVQHLIARHNIEGGVFRAYDAERRPIYEWLQTRAFDSLFFTGRLLHDATPVTCREPHEPGRREILLIDFDPYLGA